MAVTVTPARADGANARQISAVPFCTLVLSTNIHARAPPVTCVTVVLGDVALSAEMKASSSSFADVVEKAEVLTLVDAEPCPLEVETSMPIAPQAVVVTIKLARAIRRRAVTGVRLLCMVISSRVKIKGLRRCWLGICFWAGKRETVYILRIFLARALAQGNGHPLIGRSAAERLDFQKTLQPAREVQTRDAGWSISFLRCWKIVPPQKTNRLGL